MINKIINIFSIPPQPKPVLLIFTNYYIIIELTIIFKDIETLGLFSKTTYTIFDFII